MTISTTDRTAGPYAGDGVSTQFPFVFKVFQARDLVVYQTPKDKAPALLTLDVDYHVTMNTNQDSNPGGNIVLVAPLALNNTLVVSSAISALQPTALTNQGGFYPKVIEDALDRLTIIFQQLGFQNISSGLYSLKQVLRYPELDGGGPLPLLADRKNKILSFDNNGNPATALPISDSAQGVRLDLAAPGGSAMVGYDGGTAQDVLDSAKPMQSYAALRAYTGRATGVRITTSGIAGQFRRDDTDTTSGAVFTGAIAPIAAPVAPALSSAAGGTLAATTYFVKITYVTAAGETVASAESSLAVAANNVLTVTSPTAQTGATGYNVYVSTATGTETKQNSTPVAIGTSWTEPTTGLIAGAALPSASTAGSVLTVSAITNGSIAKYSTIAGVGFTASRVASILTGTGGIGTYTLYDTLTVASQAMVSDNGGTVIVDASGRRWKRLFDGVHSVKWWGAKGDNIAVDTQAIASAIYHCVLVGRKLFFPAGVYKVDSEIVIDLTTRSTGYTTPDVFFSMAGEGISNTCILYTGAANKVAFSFKGRFGTFDFLAVEHIRFQRPDDGTFIATGVNFESLALISLRNVVFFGWALGTQFSSVLTSKINECTWAYNTQAINAEKGTPNLSSPNLLNFSNCRFQANKQNTITIYGGVSNKFDCCDFEGNGRQSSGDVVVSIAGTPGDGNVSSAFDGCYFEGNAGAADVYITHPNVDLTYSFRNNIFNRVGTQRYTTSNITVDPSGLAAGAAKANIILEGNAFAGHGGYVASSARPTVNFGYGAGTYDGYSVTEFGNHFWSTTDAPIFPGTGTQARGYKVGRATYTLPALANAAVTTTTVTVKGAAVGDIACASFALTPASVLTTATVTADNTVTVSFYNVSGATVGPSTAQTLNAIVFKM